MKILSLIASNKHTTGAGFVFVVLKGIGKIADIWFPEHKDQIAGTLDVLQGIAVAYGLVAAGDGSLSAKAHRESQDAISNLKDEVAQVKQETMVLTRADVGATPAPQQTK